jgi:hypothetical protein
MRIPEVKGLYLDENGTLKQIDEIERKKWSAIFEKLEPIVSVEEWETEQQNKKKGNEKRI